MNPRGKSMRTVFLRLTSALLLLLGAAVGALTQVGVRLVGVS